MIGYIFIESGNLWLGVIVHFFNNFISITELFLLSLVPQNSSQVPGEIQIDPWLSLLISFIIGLALAYVGYRLVKILAAKMSDESKKINLQPEEQAAGSEVLIKVDGKETQTSASVSEVNKEKSEDDELSDELGTKEKPSLPTASVVMFVLSGLYLAYEWIMALIEGFLK